MFETNFVEKIKTHFGSNNFFFSWKSCHLWDKVGKYGTAREVTDDKTTRRMSIACWI